MKSIIFCKNWFKAVKFGTCTGCIWPHMHLPHATLLGIYQKQVVMSPRHRIVCRERNPTPAGVAQFRTSPVVTKQLLANTLTLKCGVCLVGCSNFNKQASNCSSLMLSRNRQTVVTECCSLHQIYDICRLLMFMLNCSILILAMRSPAESKQEPKSNFITSITYRPISVLAIVHTLHNLSARTA